MQFNLVNHKEQVWQACVEFVFSFLAFVRSVTSLRVCSSQEERLRLFHQPLAVPRAPENLHLRQTLLLPLLLL